MKKYFIAALIFLALSCQALAGSIFLSDRLEEGEFRIYETDAGSYIVKLISVSDEVEKVIFEVNNEQSKAVKIGDSHQFSDRSEIVLSKLNIRPAGEENDEAIFFFYGSGAKPLKVKNISRDIIKDSLCNFDGKCLDEEEITCCYDCGCGDSGKCVNNICQSQNAEKGSNAAAENSPQESSISPKDTKKLTKAVAWTISIFILLSVSVFFILVYRQKRRPF